MGSPSGTVEVTMNSSHQSSSSVPKTLFYELIPLNIKVKIKLKEKVMVVIKVKVTAVKMGCSGIYLGIMSLADLGEARGCSTNTFIIDSLSPALTDPL